MPSGLICLTRIFHAVKVDIVGVLEGTGTVHLGTLEYRCMLTFPHT